VAPQGADELAHLLGVAATEGWRARIEGRATWSPPDAPAHFAISTSRLIRLIAVAPADLVATVQAGLSMAELGRALGQHGAWLALDPPGDPDRSLGSVLATATAGPLRHWAGPVRDQVLGVAVVTGDGRVVRAGGRVVKNVAGYDLTKLAVGGFGAFGIIAEASLRLRAIPAAQAFLLARGELDPLIDGGSAVAQSGAELVAVELVSPGLTGSAGWTLVARLAGTQAGVAAGVEAVRRSAAPLAWDQLDPERGGAVSLALARSAADPPVTLRLGVLPDGIPDALDLVAETLDLGRVSVGLGRGGMRWSGRAPAERLVELRRRMAEREIPLTLERAPWSVRRAVGHFGAYREGVGPLSARLRRVFDPHRILAVPLEGGADV
jgi:FAD/FMN-containing dehydrogenase